MDRLSSCGKVGGDACATVHSANATTIDGNVLPFASFEGNVLLIVNVASLCGKTRAYYPQLNELQTKYGGRGLRVIGVPCNQFGLQEYGSGEEIMAILKDVRPGNGFVPNFTMTSKMDVNGSGAHPLYKLLKEQAPIPVSIKDGVETPDMTMFGNPNLAVWSPVTRADVVWNFESFLVGRDGKVVKRYHPSVTPSQIEAEISRLLA